MNGSNARRKAGGLEFRIERDLLCTADSRGYFTSLNAAWERCLGWSRDELMARPFIEFVHPDDVASTIAEASRVAEHDYELASFENRYRTKDGGWRWLRWSARSDGETWFAVAFDVSEEREAVERLRRELTDESLVAYSQPITAGRRQRIVQQELLARLRANGTLIQPDDFIPRAERHGMAGVVDRRMVREAIAQADAGHHVEVNISASTLEDDDLSGELAQSVSSIGAGARRIVFEITETAAVEQLDAACDFAERMGRMGCGFALDDFGTGYGSLTYLRSLPVQLLKIDTSFVRGLAGSRDDQRMVRAIVAMARELDLRTVAEGVEDRATLRLVRRYGVDYAQGFLIGRPQPLAELNNVLGS